MRTSIIDRVFQQEDINFLLTNRIPRRLATPFIGWFSKIEHPLVRDLSMAPWRLFAGSLNLHEAKKTTFASLHDCFIRELKEGARPDRRRRRRARQPVRRDCRRVAEGSSGTQLIQAKGFPYTLEDLLGNPRLIALYREGSYITLRLTSTMYHRFHAPCDCEVRDVTYMSGDTWNVNPIALRRIERLFCRNERAVIHASLTDSTQSIALVPVAAILVAQHSPRTS